MISKDAIKTFLERELDDFHFIKLAPREELERSIAELGTKITFKTTPRTHQLATFYLIACLESFLLFLDMGVGKSKCVLDLISYRKKLGQIGKSLVIVPSPVNIEAWREEVEKHTNLTMVGLDGSKKQRLEALEQDVDIYVINYAGLQVVMADLKPTGKKGKKKRTLNSKESKRFSDMFDLIVFDESHKCKNSSSLTFKLCNEIAKSCKYRYGMTGTPFGRDPIDLWAQFYLVDRGETLGQTLSIFQQSFFNVKINYWGGAEYKLDKKKEGLLHKVIRNRSIRYEASECQDLPEQVFITRNFYLPEHTLEQYKRFISDSHDSTELEKRQNYYIKWRQLASSFLYITEESGERTAIRYPDNPKLEILKDIVESTLDSTKIVVFYLFEESREIIKEFFKQEKISFADLKKDPLEEYKKFKTQKSCKVFLAQIQSGGTGLNLQIANYCVLYEAHPDPIVHNQALKRVHREGQASSHVFYYFLCGLGTVEEKVYAFLEEGKNLFDCLMTGQINVKDLHKN